MNRWEKLVAAIQRGDAESVAKRLDRGIDPNARDELFLTPLHYAANDGTPEIVRLLIKHGAGVEVRTGWDFAPLHLANCAESARVLIDGGADIACRNGIGKLGQWKSLGNLPLHTAVWYERMDVAALMISLGVGIDAENAEGKAVLHEAVACHGIEVVDQLLSLGADPNRPNGRGTPPILLAIECRRSNNALRLREAGAHLSEADEERLLALIDQSQR